MTREPQVAAIVATMGRPRELTALLASLAASRQAVCAVVVVDNGRDEETRRVAEESGVPAIYHRPERNLGCGGGLRVAERLAQERVGGYTHLWILDDDAVVYPETLGALLEAMAATGAVVACPLVEDREGNLNWFPGLLDRVKFREVKMARPPEMYLEACGPEPVAFSWAQGIALLVTREALEQAGPHRGDFWVRGEDLDFSLRLTAAGLGVWVPRARVQHLPPADSARPGVEYVRHAALLQNIAYVSLRLRHGRRIASTIPGNWWRFFQSWGWRPSVLLEGARAFFYGAVMGWTAGRTYGRESLAKTAKPGE